MNKLIQLALLIAVTAGIALSACGDDKKKSDGEIGKNQSALNSPSASTNEAPALPHGDINYACNSVASASGVSDPMSWTSDCIEVVSMAYRACGSKTKGDTLVQCVNGASGGDALAACLAPCE
jgi:hypothetical protein